MSQRHSIDVKRFIDDEAGVSGSASEDEDLNGQLTPPPSPTVDVDINDDIVQHRQLLNRIQRSDSAEREWMLAAHNDVALACNETLPKSPSPTPIILDDETDVTSGTPVTTASLQEEAMNIQHAVDEPIGSQPERTGTKQAGQFRLRHRTVGLTYPQCALTTQDALDQLACKLHDYDIQVLVVATEDHKEEGKHLHVYIETRKTMYTTKPTFFDLTRLCTINTNDRYHPNILIPKNKQSWMKYTIKGGNYKCFPQGFDPKLQLGAQEKHQAKIKITDAIATEVYKGTSLSSLRATFPGFMLLHSKVVQQFYNQVSIDKEQIERAKKFNTIFRFVGDGELNNQRIAGWINDNVIHNHQFRQLQLWIWGPTKIGKTSLEEMLNRNGCNIHLVDYSSKDYYEGLTDETQLIVFDEYKAQKTITEMNKLTDGSLCQVNQKGGSYKFKRPMPVLVLSNFSIKQCYSNSDDTHLATLIGRFTEIECTKNIVVETETTH